MRRPVWREQLVLRHVALEWLREVGIDGARVQPEAEGGRVPAADTAAARLGAGRRPD